MLHHSFKHFLYVGAAMAVGAVAFAAVHTGPQSEPKLVGSGEQTGEQAQPATEEVATAETKLRSLTKVAGKSVETVRIGSHQTKAAKGELVVKLRDAKAAQQFGNRLTLTSIPNFYTLSVSGPVEAASRQVAAQPGVVSASPNYVVTASLTPDDPQYNQQWGLPKISAPAAWDRTTGSASVKIASVDTGVNRNHQDLTDKIWTNLSETAGNNIDDDDNGYIDDRDGMDFVNATVSGGLLKNDADGAMDDHGHGTLTSSVFAGATDNALGIAAVDWQAKIVAVKVLDENGSGFFSDVADGVRYAADVGAGVANLSLGAFGVTSDSYTNAAIQYAVANGTVVVAASGNDGSTSQIDYPAIHPDVISVGATASNDNRASYSNGSTGLDLVAPGSGIRGATYNPNNPSNSSYGNASGTSLSAPHVAGVIGLLKGVKSALTENEARAILRGTADKVSGMDGADRTNLYGSGRLNADRAVETVKPYSATVAGQSAYPTVTPGADTTVHIDYENTGTANWSSIGAERILLGTSHAKNRISPFYNTSWVSQTRVTSFVGRVEDNNSVTNTTTIGPGEVARFQFTLTAPPRSTTGFYKEYFQPYVGGSGPGWLEDQGVYFGVTVPGRVYSYATKGQGYTSQLLQPRQRQGVTLDVTNNGTSTWRNDTNYNLQLGTDRPRNRTSDAYNSTWLSPNRAALFVGKVSGGTLTPTNKVAPGEVARFTFDLRAPAVGKSTREYFTPLVRKYGWLQDRGIYWRLTVPAQAYSYQIINQSAPLTLSDGESAISTLRIRNVGYTSWYSDGAHPVRLGTDRPRDRVSSFSDSGTADGWLGVNRIKLTRNITDNAKNVGSETSVLPGEVGEFEFELVAGSAPGNYKEYFTPLVSGIGWMTDRGIYWPIIVLP